MHRKNDVVLQISEHDERRAATSFPSPSTNPRSLSNANCFFNDKQCEVLFQQYVLFIFILLMVMVAMGTGVNRSIQA